MRRGRDRGGRTKFDSGPDKVPKRVKVREEIRCEMSW